MHNSDHQGQDCSKEGVTGQSLPIVLFPTKKLAVCVEGLCFRSRRLWNAGEDETKRGCSVNGEYGGIRGALRAPPARTPRT